MTGNPGKAKGPCFATPLCFGHRGWGLVPPCPLPFCTGWPCSVSTPSCVCSCPSDLGLMCWPGYWPWGGGGPGTADFWAEVPSWCLVPLGGPRGAPEPGQPAGPLGGLLTKDITGTTGKPMRGHCPQTLSGKPISAQTWLTYGVLSKCLPAHRREGMLHPFPNEPALPPGARRASRTR